MNISSLEQQHIYTVSQLNAEARLLIEKSFRAIWILGEISNVARPSSGHLYFSLKDEQAQIRCAFFRNHHQQLTFDLKNGQQVLVRAQPSIYETQGSYQLIVQHMEIAGAGALQIAFEQLKLTLEKEGLFSTERKKPIPTLPRTIGIITSASGAALHDILKVLKHRFCGIPIIIYATSVQGSKAAAQITQMIETANKRKECDVLILARGGGSIEDLWPFNEAIVAYAIVNSNIPIITGIGHETDFTIADFVADLRAPTPSVAAQWASPDASECLRQINSLYQRLQHMILGEIKLLQTHLHNLSKRLQHPGKRLSDDLSKINNLKQRLAVAMENKIKLEEQQCVTLTKALHALSPLNTLKRGFAIVTQADATTIIRQSNEVAPGEKIIARLAKGSLRCFVEKVCK